MKILQIFSGGQGGPNTWVLNMGRELSRQGQVLDLLHFMPMDDAFKTAVADWGGKVFYVPLLSLSSTELREELKTLGIGRYDVYHFQGHVKYYHRLQVTLRQLNPDAVFLAHAHNIQGPYSKVFDYSTLSEEDKPKFANFYWFKGWVDAYVGCSPEAIKSWYGQGLSDEEMNVFTNSVRVEDYAKSAEEAAFIKKQLRLYHKVPDDYKVLGFVGRIDSFKGIEFILELARLGQESGEKLIFVLVGTGKLEKGVREAVVAHELDNIRLISEWRDDVADLLQFFDGLLLPSLFEGVPTVVVEAQAAGLKSFVSDQIDKTCDFGLGLVEFLPVLEENTPKQWLARLTKGRESPPVPTVAERLAVFRQLRYDSPTAAAFYLKIVEDLVLQKKNRRK